MYTVSLMTARSVEWIGIFSTLQDARKFVLDTYKSHPYNAKRMIIEKDGSDGAYGYIGRKKYKTGFRYTYYNSNGLETAIDTKGKTIKRK